MWVGVKREHHGGGRASHPCILAKVPDRNRGWDWEWGQGHGIPDLAFHPGCSKGFEGKTFPCLEIFLPTRGYWLLLSQYPGLQATLKGLASVGLRAQGILWTLGSLASWQRCTNYMPTLGNKGNQGRPRLFAGESSH